MKTDRIRIQRQPLSETTVHGTSSLLIGLVLIGIGVAIGLMAFGPGEYEAAIPEGMLLVLLGFFALAGLMLVRNGTKGLARRRRADSERALHPDQPWRWDFDWDPAEARDLAGSDALKALRVAFFSLLFLVPFHWIGIYGGGGAGWLMIVGILDLVFVGLGAYGVFLLIRRAKYRDVRLRCAAHPFLLGRELSVDLVGLPREVGTVKATLRCIEEAYERRKSGGKQQRVIVCYQLYADERTASAAGSAARFTFTLPDGDRETRLRERPPRYWELEASAAVPGLDLRSRFLLPVYADPAAVRPVPTG